MTPAALSKANWGLWMKFGFAIVLLAVALLCVCALAQENTANDWHKKAMEMHLNGSYEDAISAYDKAIEIDPQNSTLWRSKAIALRDSGRFPEAIEAYGRAAELNPQENGIWNIQGFLLSELGRYSEANEAYDKAIQADPESAGAWGSKADALDNMGRHDEAVKAYEKSIEIQNNSIDANPQDSNSWAGKGHALMKMGRNDDALKAYDKAIETASSAPPFMAETAFAKAWAGKASVLDRMGKHDEALKAFDKALEFSPDYSLVLQWKGDTLMDRGKYEDALKAYEKAIDMDPAAPRIWYSKGLALWALNNSPQADAAFAKATEMGYDVLLPAAKETGSSPIVTKSWYQKGQEQERMWSWQAAVDASDQAIKLNPEYKDAWCAKCKALSNVNLELNGKGKNITFEDAINACNKAIELGPNDARSWSCKGFVLSQEAMLTGNESKFNDSLMAYEKAIEFAGADPSVLAEAWRGKGAVLSRMNRNNEALTAQEKAINLNESDVEAWMGKAMALSELGRNEEAVQSFDRIIDLYPSEDQRIFDYPYIWYSKGRALEKLGRDEEAAHAYNKSIEDVDTIIDWVASGRDFYMNLSEAWQYKGQLLEEQGRYEEAVQALENATRVNPESQRDWRELGSILARDLGRYNQSLEAYERALPLDSGDGDTLAGKANVLRSLGKYDEALELYEKVLQLDTRSPYGFHYLAKAWLGKGEIFRMQGRYSESLLAYDKALELDPRYPEDVWIGRGRLMDSMDRPQEAQREYNQSFRSYREIVKNNSRRCDIWHGLGNTLLGLKRYEEALQAYDNATMLNPNYAEAWFDMGLAFLALNRDAEAEAAFARARILGYGDELQLLLAPPAITNITSLGNDEFIEMANNENVTRWFRNLRLIVDGDENKSIIIPSFSLEPGQKICLHFGQGKSNQTDLYLSSKIGLNDMAGNLTLMDTSLGIEKGYLEYWTPPALEDTAGYWLKKGNEAAGKGAFEEARKDFHKAIQIDAKNPEAWRGIGNAQIALGKEDDGKQSLEKSLHLFKETIEDNPEDFNALYNMSMVLTALERPKEALDMLDRILELDPDNYGTLGRKVEVLGILGMYNESMDAYEKALQLIPVNATERLFIFWMSKGWTQLAHGDDEAALNAFEKGITLDPEEESAWFFKGKSLKALGRNTEAEAAFAKAKELGYNG